MMTKEEFTEYALSKMKDALRRKYPEAEVEINTVRRSFSHKAETIIFWLYDSDFGIAMDLEDLYALNQTDRDKSLQRLLQNVEKKLLAIKPENLINYRKWESAKDNVTACLFGKDKTLALQDEFPGRALDGTDLSIFYGIGRYGKSPVPVDNKMMSAWKITETDLYDRAIANLAKTDVTFRAVIPEAGQARQIPGIADINIEKLEDYVLPQGILYELTTKEHSYGAAAILIPGLLKRIEKQFQGSLLLIPSSVHEFLLLHDADKAPELIQSVIVSLNKSAANQDDILSNNVYVYKDGELMMVTEEKVNEIVKQFLPVISNNDKIEEEDMEY